MGLQNWRWWHWTLASILLGGVIGFVFTRMDTDDPSLASTSFSTMRAKLERRTDAGDSLVTGIRVGPITLDVNNNKVQSVTFYERQHNRVTGKWDPTVQYRTVTPVPLSTASPRPDYGVLDYLTERQKDIKTLDWKYQWWLVPKNIWLLSLGGSILLIGILWPMTLKVLVKLGLAEPPTERMGSLASVQITDDSSELSAGAVVTADDRQKLADLNAELEANVAGMTVATPVNNYSSVAEPVRLLKGDAVTEVTGATSDQAAKDYKGDFYPVARPAGKK